MQTTKERLILFLKSINLSQACFAETIGVSRAYVNSMTDNPTLNTIENIKKHYPELNINWLLTGDDEMLKQPNVMQSGKQNINISGSRNSNIGNRNYAHRHETNNSSEEPQRSIGIPLIPFDFIAGYGEDDNVGIKLNDCERYVVPEFENTGAEFLVRVGGSSMYPKYSSGDILACRKIRDILFFQWGKIYVIDSSQGQLIKRICRHENEDMVWLVSDNKEKYEPFAIPKNDIRSLSIVVGAVRME